MSRNLITDKNFKILLVEDEPILAMAMELKLEKLGFGVSGIATTPDSAIIHVENHFPDMAIIDINLSNPNKNGIDVANYIWKNFNIPIIFLTSYYNNNIMDKAMEAEPYAYLVKPCRNEELKATINTAMHKHQFFFKNKQLLNNIADKYINITEKIKYNKTTSELYQENKVVKLTKNEKKLFDILAKNEGKVICYDSIFNYIWREDVYDLSKLRSLIYRLKIKLGENPFESLYEQGYRIKVFE